MLAPFARPPPDPHAGKEWGLFEHKTSYDHKEQFCVDERIFQSATPPLGDAQRAPDLTRRVTKQRIPAQSMLTEHGGAETPKAGQTVGGRSLPRYVHSDRTIL